MPNRYGEPVLGIFSCCLEQADRFLIPAEPANAAPFCRLPVKVSWTGEHDVLYDFFSKLTIQYLDKRFFFEQQFLPPNGGIDRDEDPARIDLYDPRMNRDLRPDQLRPDVFDRGLFNTFIQPALFQLPGDDGRN